MKATISWADEEARAVAYQVKPELYKLEQRRKQLGAKFLKKDIIIRGVIAVMQSTDFFLRAFLFTPKSYDLVEFLDNFLPGDPFWDSSNVVGRFHDKISPYTTGSFITYTHPTELQHNLSWADYYKTLGYGVSEWGMNYAWPFSGFELGQGVFIIRGASNRVVRLDKNEGDLVFTRGYTQVPLGNDPDGKFYACAAGRTGLHTYYKEDDSGGAQHFWLLTFDDALAVSRTISLTTNLNTPGGFNTYPQADALEEDVYVGGHAFSAVDTLGGIEVIRVDKSGAETTYTLTAGASIGPYEQFREIACGKNNVYVLTEQFDSQTLLGTASGGNDYLDHYTMRVYKIDKAFTSDSIIWTDQMDMTAGLPWRFPSIAVTPREELMYVLWPDGFFPALYPSYPLQGKFQVVDLNAGPPAVIDTVLGGSFDDYPFRIRYGRTR